MARSDFGGTVSDFVFSSYTFAGRQLLNLSSASLTFWDSKTGGTQYTDLLLNGVATSTIAVGTDGQVPLFQGPDGITQMWADAGGGRVKMVASNPLLSTFVNLARTPDAIISGTVTRDGNGAATSAPVMWPDGSPGTYTADTVSTAFPGAVDAYHVTYGSPVTKTYTQPAVTRDANGAATNVPAITVS